MPGCADKEWDAGDGGEVLPLVTRPPNFPAPVDKPYRRPGRPRALFRRRKASAENSDEEGTETESDNAADYDSAVGALPIFIHIREDLCKEK